MRKMMRNQRKEPEGRGLRLKGQRGFSLVELICAVAIMGILSATIGVAMVASVRNFSRGQAEADVQSEAQTALNVITDILLDATSAAKAEDSGALVIGGTNIDGHSYSYTVEFRSGERRLDYTYEEADADVDDAGNPVPRFLSGTLAYDVTDFKFDASDFAKTRNVKNLQIAVEKNDRVIYVASNTTSRNYAVTDVGQVDASSLSETQQKPSIALNETDIVLEPNQRYEVGMLISGSCDSITYDPPLDEGITYELCETENGWVIEVNVNATAKEKAEARTVTVTVENSMADEADNSSSAELNIRIRRVDLENYAREVSASERTSYGWSPEGLRNAPYGAEAEYTVRVENIDAYVSNWEFGGWGAGYDTGVDNAYINPTELAFTTSSPYASVSWVPARTGDYTHPYAYDVKIHLNQELPAGASVVVNVVSLHAKGGVRKNETLSGYANQTADYDKFYNKASRQADDDAPVNGTVASAGYDYAVGYNCVNGTITLTRTSDGFGRFGMVDVSSEIMAAYPDALDSNETVNPPLYFSATIYSTTSGSDDRINEWTIGQSLNKNWGGWALVEGSMIEHHKTAQQYKYFCIPAMIAASELQSTTISRLYFINNNTSINANNGTGYEPYAILWNGEYGSACKLGVLYLPNPASFTDSYYSDIYSYYRLGVNTVHLQITSPVNLTIDQPLSSVSIGYCATGAASKDDYTNKSGNEDFYVNIVEDGSSYKAYTKDGDELTLTGNADGSYSLRIFYTLRSGWDHEWDDGYEPAILYADSHRNPADFLANHFAVAMKDMDGNWNAYYYNGVTHYDNNLTRKLSMTCASDGTLGQIEFSQGWTNLPYLTGAYFEMKFPAGFIEGNSGEEMKVTYEGNKYEGWPYYFNEKASYDSMMGCDGKVFISFPGERQERSYLEGITFTASNMTADDPAEYGLYYASTTVHMSAHEGKTFTVKLQRWDGSFWVDDPTPGYKYKTDDWGTQGSFEVGASGVSYNTNYRIILGMDDYYDAPQDGVNVIYFHLQ